MVTLATLRLRLAPWLPSGMEWSAFERMVGEQGLPVAELQQGLRSPESFVVSVMGSQADATSRERQERLREKVVPRLLELGWSWEEALPGVQAEEREGARVDGWLEEEVGGAAVVH